jgi:ABC-type phosphate transport system substrate-binding protein
MRNLKSQYPGRAILLAALCLNVFLIACLNVCLGAAPSLAADGEPDIAIVVGPGVPVDNLTFADLRRILLGDRQFWSANLKVTLLVRAPGARERDVVLKAVYQMSEAQFRQYWIAKVFRAEASSGPKIVYSNDMAAETALALPGAVAFMDASQVPKGLKVLRINGALPGEKNYPLR